MKISMNLATILVQDAVEQFDITGTSRIEIFDGTEPTETTDPDDGVLLATLQFDTTAFIFPSDNVATANPINADIFADATGTARYFRIKKSTDEVMMQGSVGVSGSDINFDDVNFTIGSLVAITSATLTMPVEP